LAKTFTLGPSTASGMPTGADFTRLLDVTPAGAGSIVVTIASGTTEVSYGYTPVGNPGTNGATGDYTVEINVTVKNGKIDGSVQVHRVNSSGAVQSSSSVTSAQTLSVVQVYTFNLNSVDLGTWAAGDRLRVDYRFTETGGHGDQDVTIGTGTTSEEVVAPFTGESSSVSPSESASESPSASASESPSESARSSASR